MFSAKRTLESMKMSAKYHTEKFSTSRRHGCGQEIAYECYPTKEIAPKNCKMPSEVSENAACNETKKIDLDCNHLLRVTLLSLEGIQLSQSVLSNGTNENIASVDNEYAVDRCIADSSASKSAGPSILPDLRITAWVGFRSSFPSESTYVPSSQYASFFFRQESMLAVESDVVAPMQSPEWQSTCNFTSSVKGASSSIKNDSTGPESTELINNAATMKASESWCSGMAQWKSCKSEEVGDWKSSESSCKSLEQQKERIGDCVSGGRELPHLEIRLPSQTFVEEHCSESRNDDDGLRTPPLPDIIELHVSIVCNSMDNRTINEKNDGISTYSMKTDKNFNMIDSEKDIFGADLNDGTNDSERVSNHARQDQIICHGIAHLKVPHTGLSNSGIGTFSGGIDDGGETLQLPIHSTASSMDEKDHSDRAKETIQLASDATLSIRVERISAINPAAASDASTDRNSSSQEQWNQDYSQRHYVDVGWNDIGVEIQGLAPPSVIHENNSKESDRVNYGGSTKEGSSSSFQWFPKTVKSIPIVSNLLMKSSSRSSLKGDEKQCEKQIHCTIEKNEKICAPIRSQKDNTYNIAGVAVNKSLASQNESRPFAQCKSDCVKGGTDGSMKANNPLKPPVDKGPQESSKSISQQLRDKLLCGATFSLGEALQTLAEAAHHCDEDHVAIYVQDSQSMDSSIATPENAGF